MTERLLDISQISGRSWNLELSAGVHKARLAHNDQLYVYKEVDRPLYVPRDTDILEDELKNLKKLSGSAHIVQLVAVVISRNPYQTISSATDVDHLLVMRGLLLEYHPKGTLADALQPSGTDRDSRCRHPVAEMGASGRIRTLTNFTGTILHIWT